MSQSNHAVVKGAKITNIVSAALMATSGVTLMLLPNLSQTGSQRTLLAVLFLLACASKLLGYFSNDLYRLAFQFDFAGGIFCGLLAVGLLVAPEKTFSLLHMALVAYVVLDGLLKLQIAMDARRFGMRSWVGILISSIAMCLVAAAAAGGLLDEWLPNYLCVGAVLTFNGIQNVWITAHTVRVRVRKKNRAERFGMTEEENDP